ncbi:MAG TPA: 2,3-bisphosphoglycerate-independent phosphoglycerate mutase [Candidatus Baltobacteraceae bacterium]|nr:2,3-bisphosphoglycerate-independent phosphoglycerate mutase [Candidatus Baltobacteraceae bacterium]
MKYRPLVLAVLDGWGCSSQMHGNAIAAASLPHWHAFFDKYPWTMLEASGEAVGLPKGIMGNSEVGHMNLGSGRVVPQGVVIIDADIASGEFAKNATLNKCIQHVKASGGTLHFMGLLSDGKVHSSLDHLTELIRCTHGAGAKFAIHAFLDGRDTPPRSAAKYLQQVEDNLAQLKETGAIRTVIGRYYAMDRDKRWERTQLAYDALAFGEAPFHATTAMEALQAAYARGEDDEFVKPTIVGNAQPIGDGDAVIFFNFRPDRARQMTLAFNASTSHPEASNSHPEVSKDPEASKGAQPADFPFPLKPLHNFIFATMTKYDETFPNPVLFGPRPQFDTFGEIVSREGMRQLRLAETEKYAHVTYFFNGGREDVFPGEDRKLIASDRSVPTYDLAPAMRAHEITDYAVEQIENGTYDVIIMNYANADMVGHTGKWEPTIESVQILDECLQRLSDAVLQAGGLLVITADHGNAEEKIDKDGNPLTAHTTNPVPLLLIGNGISGQLKSGGKLGDVAPTLLRIMDLPVPDAMTGDNLFTAASVTR